MIASETSDNGIIPLEKEHLISTYTSVPSLGGTLENLPISLSKHKHCLNTITALIKIVLDYIRKHNNLFETHFITIRPSPEHVYHEWGKRILSYDKQIEYFTSCTHDDNIRIMSTSVEKGHKNTSILHYHLVVIASKNSLKKWLKRITNRFTCLHQLYGYQKAVVVSETQNHNLEEGVCYFNGLQIDKTNSEYTLTGKDFMDLPKKLKTDCYKHIIRTDILQLITRIIKKHLKI